VIKSEADRDGGHERTDAASKSNCYCIKKPKRDASNNTSGSVGKFAEKVIKVEQKVKDKRECTRMNGRRTG
jgi:hypothetical protein